MRVRVSAALAAWVLTAVTVCRGSPERDAASTIITSNGMIAALVNTRAGIIEEIYPRIFHSPDLARPVEPFIQDLTLEGAGHPRHVGYLRNTHLISAEYPSLTVTYFAPFTSGERVFYAVLDGERDAVARARFSWKRASSGLRTMEMDFDRPGKGRRKYVLFAVHDALLTDAGDLRPSAARLQTSQGSLLEDETRYMRMLLDRVRLPSTVTDAELDLAERSISVLKMGQVSLFESEKRFRGQTVAFLPPGDRHAAPIRDACFAVLAFSRIGLFEEARGGLTFLLSLPLSDHATPLSTLGLLLTAYCDYVRRSDDRTFLSETYPRVTEQIADVLVASIGRNGVMREFTHEEESGGKHFASTSIACAAGLRDFAELSKRHGLPDWPAYAAPAEQLRAGIMRHFVVGGMYLKGVAGLRSRESAGYYDVATFEAFASGLFKDGSLFDSHRKIYASQTVEIFLTLRIASAASRCGRPRLASSLLRQVTVSARRTHNLIPERRGSPESGGTGACPMVGAGAGAYLLALWDLHETV